MDELIVVTHPEPILLEARPLEVEQVSEGNVAMAYYHGDKLVARGFVASEAVKAITGILSNPVSIALAASEDDSGNIDARFCLVLPVDPDKFPADDDDEEGEEPWRASVPELPAFGTAFDPDALIDDDEDDLDDDDLDDDDLDDDEDEDDEDDDEHPRVALLPIGNVVRPVRERHQPYDMARDLRDMLLNLMDGKATDAVAKAIDDLLNSL